MSKFVQETINGDSYHIPAGVVHAAEIRTFARIMDFFEEHDRYQKE